jgi:hypothetical protein
LETLLHQEESKMAGASTAKQNYCLKPKLLSKPDLDYPGATWMLDAGCWILDAGRIYQLASNIHPPRPALRPTF